MAWVGLQAGAGLYYLPPPPPPTSLLLLSRCHCISIFLLFFVSCGTCGWFSLEDKPNQFPQMAFVDGWHIYDEDEDDEGVEEEGGDSGAFVQILCCRYTSHIRMYVNQLGIMFENLDCYLLSKN